MKSTIIGVCIIIATVIIGNLVARTFRSSYESQQKKLKTLEEDYKKIKKELTSEITKGTKTINNIFNSFLTFLEQNTTPMTWLTKIEYANKQFAISGHSVSLKDMNLFFTKLRDIGKSFKVNEIKQNNEGINAFNVTLEVSQ